MRQEQGIRRSEVPAVRILAPASDEPVVVEIEGDPREIFDYLHANRDAWVDRVILALKRALDDASLDVYLDEERGRGG